ncbi:MAG: hypothetical protein J6X86_04950 [Bacteroidales bacterium]|nr:hypothetical protein [Bacteroidales bacterium]
MMKRNFLFIAFVLAVLGATAQNRPVEIRDDIVEAENNGESYTVFSYTLKDGSFGYWLGLGDVDHIPGSIFVFDGVTETCIYLGATATEALATLDTIVECFDMGDQTREFPAMMSIGLPLVFNGTATCFVQKQLIGKRLCFRFTHEGYTTESFLNRAGAKNVRNTFKFNARKELKTERQ